ncbi:hypothetical protein Salat_0221000 [Sesamum alatum]|uniref:RNase H type-1 domain-containing protein n=1 Tax=Sesamum alatum TaxID=300844 RepID=A0AAE1YYY1_9LAMI|nr:hypothetical protein Salat_0221000 [Sesamum alatum]
MTIIQQAKRLLEAFRITTKDDGNGMMRPRQTKWQKPPTDFIKLKFDGAVFWTEGGVGSRVIARDVEGMCLGWRIGFQRGTLDATVAEALAARCAADLVVQYG